MGVLMIDAIISSVPWRVQSRLRVVTDIQEWLNQSWLSQRVISAQMVRPAVAESYPGFPLNVRWARVGGGFEPRYAYELKDVQVAAATGLVTMDGRVFAESVGDHLNAGTVAFAWRLARPLATLFRRIEKLPDNARYTYLRPEGYFHFVMESVVQLCLSLRCAPDACVLLHGGEHGNFYEGYVDLLKERGSIRKTRRIYSPVFLAPRYVMAAAEQDAGMFCRETVNLLRDVFLKDLEDIPATRRIFITRRGRRMFGNQKRLEDMALACGFEVVDTDGMTISRQINLFRSCAVIVANHGAGLTNLVYSPPGCRVVELFSPKWLNDCYFRLASICGIDYRCLVADECGEWGNIDEYAFQEALASHK